MSQYDEYFTNEDKPFAENLNDALLVSNVFDLNIPIVLPDDFSNGAWVDTGNKRKCHVSIVQVTDFDNLTVTGSSLTGYGGLRFRFYPNFNSFGKIRGVDWNGSVDEVIVNDANGNSLCSVTEPGNFPNVSGLRTLQNFEIIVKINGELEDLTLVLENKVKSARHTVSATVEDIDGLSDALDSIETINSNQDLLIENKVDKVNGKGLSTNDYTNADKAKVSSLKAVATSGNYSDLNDKPTIPAKTSDLANDGADGTNVYVSNNDSRLSNARTPTAHTHGNVTNDGKIGSTSGKIVVTGTNGVLQGADTITKSKISDFSHTHTKSQISDFTHTHTKSQITDFPSTMTPSSHAHGSITNDGKLATANGIVITDANKNITASSTITKSKISDFPSTMTPSAHKHGNLTNDGKIGTVENKPIITTTDGVLAAGSFGSTAGTFCQGNDTRLSNARTPTAHTHGDISNTGAITSTAVDFSSSDVPIVADASNSGKLQKGTVPTGYIKDPTAHSNIGSSSNETQSSINTKIDTKLGGLKWKIVEDLSNFYGVICYNDYFVYVMIVKSGVKISTANVYNNLFSGTIPEAYRPSANIVQNNTGTVDVRIKINTDGTVQIMGTQTITNAFTVNIGFLYARV